MIIKSNLWSTQLNMNLYFFHSRMLAIQFLADFRIDQFVARSTDKEQRVNNITLDSVSIDAAKPFQSRNKKPIENIRNT